jgi:hypothetical protein
VPVEWYKVVNGRWVFHDWAVITPFIYVDDDFSVPMGRMVYGFPKALARARAVENDWIRDVRAPITLAQIETAVFPEVYQGDELETRVFLEVERAPPMANFQLPPNPRSPAAPWTMAAHIADAVGGLSRDAMWMAQAMRIFGVNPGDHQSIPPEMLNRARSMVDPAGPGIVLNSLNLKQFRRSAAPMEIAYQGLTNGPMQLTAFSRGGWLNEERMMLGDMSGGHRVKLHEYTTLPIVRKLGLEVERRWRGDGVDVAELVPVMPFWMETNVRYADGVNLAWRTGKGPWKDGSGKTVETPSTPVSLKREKPRFNTTLASAVEAITGPFQYAGTTVRVLPLLANVEKLQKYVDAYINDALDNKPDDGEPRSAPASGIRLSVWHRPPAQVDQGDPIGGSTAYVYMTASSYESVTSLTNNAGDWAKYELSFMIPVKLERQGDDGKWVTEGVGVVPTFNFVDRSIAAIARLEVEGISTQRAEFIRPDIDWLSDGQSPVGEEQTLLRIEGEVIHAIGEDQQTALEPIVEIFRIKKANAFASANSRDAMSNWVNLLRREQGTKKGTKAKFPEQCKVARALALEILGNRTPIAMYSLKQIRDVTDPTKACYQSLERQSRSFQDLLDIREIEQNVVVRFRDFPTLKLVDTLGIVGQSTPGEGAGVIHTTHAVRPFYIQGTINESFSEPVATRAGTEEWEVSEEVFNTRLSTQPNDLTPKFVANRQCETLQDQGDPCRMHHLMRQTAQGTLPPMSPGAGYGVESVIPSAVPPGLTESEWLRQRISPEEARNALEIIDPQIVIDSVLSREWGNADPNARWRLGIAELSAGYGDLLAGSTGKHAADAEQALYEIANKKMATRPGSSPKLNEDVIKGLVPLHEATLWRKALEQHFAVLAAWTIFRLDGRLVQQSIEIAKVVKARASASEAPQIDADMMPSALCASLRELLVAISNIAHMKIGWGPSPDHHLSTKISGDQIRLDEIIRQDLLPVALEFGLNTADPNCPWEINPPTDETLPSEDEIATEIESRRQLEIAWMQLDTFRQATELARAKCEIQRNALVTKLSRAYQKPDFCINRSPIGPERDDMLPASLAWDNNWYYGKRIDAQSVGGVAHDNDEEGQSS